MRYRYLRGSGSSAVAPRKLVQLSLVVLGLRKHLNCGGLDLAAAAAEDGTEAVVDM